mmetsp:Transcript_13452/g.11947  ORF Transcript_13452/g.11947 Transcript_13452/m.11947 type:complete len:157 (+) Transcript_13452:228-698(+)
MESDIKLIKQLSKKSKINSKEFPDSMQQLWDSNRLSQKSLNFYIRKAHFYFSSVYKEFDTGLLTHPKDLNLKLDGRKSSKLPFPMDTNKFVYSNKLEEVFGCILSLSDFSIKKALFAIATKMVYFLFEKAYNEMLKSDLIFKCEINAMKSKDKDDY